MAFRTSNLQCLFRSDAGIAADSMDSWVDQSDNRNDFGVVGAVSRIANQIDGKPCVRLGSDGILYFTNVLMLIPRTIYVVIRVPDDAAVRTIMAGKNASLQWRAESSRQRLVNAGVSDIGFADDPFTPEAWVQLNVSWDFQQGIFRQAKTAVGIVDVMADAGYTPTRYVGVRNQDGAWYDFLNADLALLAIYNGVDSLEQRQATENEISAIFPSV